MADANSEAEKTRKALVRLERELRIEGEVGQADLIVKVLQSEMSVLRLAAILAPEN